MSEVGNLNHRNPAEEAAATFDPAHPPPRRTSYRGLEPERTWEQCKEHWDQLIGELAAVTVQSPTIFAAVAQGAEGVHALADGSPQQALVQIGKVLGQTKAAIMATQSELAAGDLDWTALKPLHAQLLNGQREGGAPWTEEYAKAVAKNTLAEHGESEQIQDGVIGAIGTLLFVVAEIGSFGIAGLATGALLAGIALGGQQALGSWNDYEGLAAAAASATSEETRMVNPEDVAGARLEAIADSIFLFLDVAGPVVKSARALRDSRSLAAGAAEHSVARRLEQAAADESLGGGTGSGLVREALDELGVAETVRRSGGTADQLVKMLRDQGGPSDLAAQRVQTAIERGFVPGTRSQPSHGIVDDVLTAAKDTDSRLAVTRASGHDADFMTGRSLDEALRDLHRAATDGKVSGAFADQLLEEAIERLGPRRTVALVGGGSRRRSCSAAARPPGDASWSGAG